MEFHGIGKECGRQVGFRVSILHFYFGREGTDVGGLRSYIYLEYMWGSRLRI